VWSYTTGCARLLPFILIDIIMDGGVVLYNWICKVITIYINIRAAFSLKRSRNTI